jgi:hypothetical protein
MKYLQITSIILFLISIGSMRIHRIKNADAMIESSIIGKSLLSMVSLLSFIMLFFTVENINHTKWYWNFGISILLTLFLSEIFANIYSSIIGIKSKPVMSIRASGYIRHNINIIDAIITLIVALILFIICKYI